MDSLGIKKKKKKKLKKIKTTGQWVGVLVEGPGECGLRMCPLGVTWSSRHCFLLLGGGFRFPLLLGFFAEGTQFRCPVFLLVHMSWRTPVSVPVSPTECSRAAKKGGDSGWPVPGWTVLHHPRPCPSPHTVLGDTRSCFCQGLSPAPTPPHASWACSVPPPAPSASTHPCHHLDPHRQCSEAGQARVTTAGAGGQPCLVWFQASFRPRHLAFLHMAPAPRQGPGVGVTTGSSPALAQSLGSPLEEGSSP